MEIDTHPITNTQNLKETILKLKTAMTVVFKSREDIYNNVEYITILIDETRNVAMFKKKFSSDFIELDLNNLENNPYSITDISELYTVINILEDSKIQSNEMDIVDDIEIVTNEFIDIDISPIGTDNFIRELKTYERDFTYLEYKEDILQSLKNIGNKNDVYTFDRLDKRAEFILNNLTNCNNSRTLPTIFMDNNYHSILKPIVNDCKKIYTEVPEYLEGNIDSHPNIYFTNFETEFNALEKMNEDFFTGILNRTDFYRNLHTQFEFEDEHGGVATIKSASRPYLINDTTPYGFYKTINKNFQDVYRVCNPNNPCVSLQFNKNTFDRDNMIPKMKLDKRIAEGSIYNLKDLPLDRFITDRNSSGLQTSTCNGTGKVPEHYYRESINKKEHKISFFNKTLNEHPIQLPFIEGEEINIVGVLLRSIHSYQPTFIDTYSINEMGDKDDDGFSRKTIFYETNNIGYNLVDHIFFNRENQNSIKHNNIIKNIHLHDEISNLDTFQIDYTKDNFIYFNKTNNDEIHQDKILEDLKNIIPTIENVYRIEDTLSKCSNFKQVDKILNKYNLSIFNTDIDTIHKINIQQIFNQNIDKIKQYSTYSKLNHIDVKRQHNLNTIILDSILNKIDEIDSILYNNDFSPEEPSIYTELLTQTVLNSLSKNTYSIHELENMIMNKLDIYVEYTSNTLHESEKQQELLHIIITNIVSNKYNLHYYKNNYLQNIIHSNEQEYTGIIDNIHALYGIDELEFKRLSGDNATIHILNKLNKSFDGGTLLYTFFNNIILKKGLNEINQELIILAKEYYIKNIGSLELWEPLTNVQQLNYISSIELYNFTISKHSHFSK